MRDIRMKAELVSMKEDTNDEGKNTGKTIITVVVDLDFYKEMKPTFILEYAPSKWKFRNTKVDINLSPKVVDSLNGLFYDG